MPDGQFFKDVLVCVEIVTDGQGTTLEDRIGDDDERERLFEPRRGPGERFGVAGYSGYWSDPVEYDATGSQLH